ncbi:MAG: CHAP domain-containing protein [Bifidobacteriaceae bacterium]|jgi:surface antigen|nr:CHAP domain-containing protein [Bifidobacteriaceae bacterium]
MSKRRTLLYLYVIALVICFGFQNKYLSDGAGSYSLAEKDNSKTSLKSDFFNEDVAAASADTNNSIKTDSNSLYKLPELNVPFSERVIPVRAAPEVPEYHPTARVAAQEFSATARNTGVAPGNRYVWRNCTWYAYNRRYFMGRPVPPMLGNGGQWARNAARAGFVVNNVPEIGAVMVEHNTYYGHVAIVEEVGTNNSVRVSEYNVIPLSYGERWISNASSKEYIH